MLDYNTIMKARQLLDEEYIRTEDLWGIVEYRGKFYSLEKGKVKEIVWEKCQT